jgi:hypothetical protein
MITYKLIEECLEDARKYWETTNVAHLNTIHDRLADVMEACMDDGDNDGDLVFDIIHVGARRGLKASEIARILRLANFEVECMHSYDDFIDQILISHKAAMNIDSSISSCGYNTDGARWHVLYFSDFLKLAQELNSGNCTVQDTGAGPFRWVHKFNVRGVTVFCLTDRCDGSDKLEKER